MWRELRQEMLSKKQLSQKGEQGHVEKGMSIHQELIQYFKEREDLDTINREIDYLEESSNEGSKVILYIRDLTKTLHKWVHTKGVDLQKGSQRLFSSPQYQKQIREIGNIVNTQVQSIVNNHTRNNTRETRVLTEGNITNNNRKVYMERGSSTPIGRVNYSEVIQKIATQKQDSKEIAKGIVKELNSHSIFKNNINSNTRGGGELQQKLKEILDSSLSLDEKFFAI